MEEIDFCLEGAKESMELAYQNTAKEFTKVRAGKATPNMLDGINVEYYGSRSPLSQIASINTPDARTLIIKPWEKGSLADIETALVNSDLGLNPQNDGETIKLYLPPLTEERRIELTKIVRNEAENGKIRLRNSRKETNDELKKIKNDGASEDDIKRAEDEVQKITDSFSSKIDAITLKKEEEIMTI